jgi:hypothetical protein
MLLAILISWDSPLKLWDRFPCRTLSKSSLNRVLRGAPISVIYNPENTSDDSYTEQEKMCSIQVIYSLFYLSTRVLFYFLSQKTSYSTFGYIQNQNRSDQRWGLWAFHASVFNLRPFDLSMAFGRPPSIQCICVSQRRRLNAIGQKKGSSHSQAIIRARIFKRVWGPGINSKE